MLEFNARQGKLRTILEYSCPIKLDHDLISIFILFDVTHGDGLLSLQQQRKSVESECRRADAREDAPGIQLRTDGISTGGVIDYRAFIIRGQTRKGRKENGHRTRLAIVSHCHDNLDRKPVPARLRYSSFERTVQLGRQISRWPSESACVGTSHSGCTNHANRRRSRHPVRHSSTYIQRIPICK